MTIKSLKQFILKHKIETAIFLAIILVASFVRFYKIREFVVFLGDEGRDALVVKRMIVDHDLTLLGPTASVGGFYLGPVYYYFMIPAMILSGLDPVGPAVMVAIMGITTVALLYYILRDWFGRFPAQITALLYALSPGVVTFSRSSWNPNPMPLFSLLSVIGLHYAITKKKLYLAFLSAVCLGIAIQLHYLGLLLGPVLAIITFVQAPRKTWAKLIPTQIFGFLVGASLYLAFEIRHGFPNIKSVIEFVNRDGATTGPRTGNLFKLFYEVSRFNIESILSKNLAEVTPFVTVSLIVLAVSALVYFFKTKQITRTHPILTIAIYWIVGTLGIGMYRGQLHYHYFEFLFTVPYLLLGFLLWKARSVKLQIPIWILTLCISAFLTSKMPIWGRGSNLLIQTEIVADKVIELSEGKPYNFALITPGNSDHAYRFYLEAKNRKNTPIEEKVEEQLIIVCEQEIELCKPLGHPLWEIASFGRAEVVEEVIIQPGLNVFRLIHHSESQDRIGKPAPRG